MSMTPEEEQTLSEMFDADPDSIIIGEGHDDLCEPNMDEDEPRDPEDIQEDINEIIEDIKDNTWKGDSEVAKLYLELACLYNERKDDESYNDIEDQINAAQIGLKYDRDNAELNFLMGEGLLSRSEASEFARIEDCFVYLKKAYDLDPMNTDYIAALSLYYIDLDQPKIEEALDLAKKGHEIDPHNIQILVNMKDCYLELGNLEKQIETLNALIDLEPEERGWKEALEWAKNEYEREHQKPYPPS